MHANKCIYINKIHVTICDIFHMSLWKIIIYGNLKPIVIMFLAQCGAAREICKK